MFQIIKTIISKFRKHVAPVKIERTVPYEAYPKVDKIDPNRYLPKKSGKVTLKTQKKYQWAKDKIELPQILEQLKTAKKGTPERKALLNRKWTIENRAKTRVYGKHYYKKLKTTQIVSVEKIQVVEQPKGHVVEVDGVPFILPEEIQLIEDKKDVSNI